MWNGVGWGWGGAGAVVGRRWSGMGPPWARDPHLYLSEDSGPHAVFFPGCEGLEGGWDYPDGRRRLVSQNIRVITQNIRVITRNLRVTTQNIRVITQNILGITPHILGIIQNILGITQNSFVIFGFVVFIVGQKSEKTFKKSENGKLFLVIPNMFWVIPNMFWIIPSMFWVIPSMFWGTGTDLMYGILDFCI